MSRHGLFSSVRLSSNHRIYTLLSQRQTPLVGAQLSLTEFLESHYTDAQYDSVKKSLLEQGAILFFIGKERFSFDQCRVIDGNVTIEERSLAAVTDRFFDLMHFLNEVKKIKCDQEDNGFELLTSMDDSTHQEMIFFSFLLRICITPVTAIEIAMRDDPVGAAFWINKKRMLVSYLFKHDDFMRWFKTISDESILKIISERSNPVIDLRLDMVKAEYRIFCFDAGLCFIKEGINKLSDFLTRIRSHNIGSIPLNFYSMALALHDFCIEVLDALEKNKLHNAEEVIFLLSQLEANLSNMLSFSMASEAGVYGSEWNGLLEKIKKSLDIIKRFAIPHEQIQEELQRSVADKKKKKTIKEAEDFNRDTLCDAVIRWFVLNGTQKGRDVSRNQKMIYEMLSSVHKSAVSPVATVNELVRSTSVLAAVGVREPHAVFSWCVTSALASVMPKTNFSASQGWHMGWLRNELDAAPFSMMPRGGLTYFLEERKEYLSEARRTSTEMGDLFFDIFQGYCASKDDTAHHNAVMADFLKMLIEQVMREKYLIACLREGCFPDGDWKNHVTVKTRIESIVNYFFELSANPGAFKEKINAIVAVESEEHACEENGEVVPHHFLAAHSA